MIRKIIHIDEEKCNGCGACAAACHEGAIGIVDGKAKLLRDDYATVSATACRPARWTPSTLLSARRLPMMLRPCRRICAKGRRRARLCTPAAVPAAGCAASAVRRPRSRRLPCSSRRSSASGRARSSSCRSTRRIFRARNCSLRPTARRMPTRTCTVNS